MAATAGNESQQKDDAKTERPGCLMCGTGEYTTGFVGGGAANSDKSTGIVALVCLDLQARGKLGRLGMCGTNGRKLPQIRAHMQRVLGDVYDGIDPSIVETFPADDVVDPEAFRPAVEAFNAGDCAIVFTPDNTHLDIALACIRRGMHVLITKPPVKTLEEHRQLMDAAAEHKVLVQVELHKRFDPIYADARDRIQQLGPFSFFNSYMSQPKHQLDTFKAWAGKSSDISYYLNSHHVDFHVWTQRGRSRPIVVTALSSTGVADARLEDVQTEDTITLAVQWQNLGEGAGSTGHALYSSSWVAPKSDVHSQQRWFYMGQSGEVAVDQAHRGYTVSTDKDGFTNANPLFWKPAPTNGRFAGQRCYGYISFESFVEAAHEINSGRATPSDFDDTLPTIGTTVASTAILEAGRRSLDAGGRPMRLIYSGNTDVVPLRIEKSDA